MGIRGCWATIASEGDLPRAVAAVVTHPTSPLGTCPLPCCAPAPAGATGLSPWPSPPCAAGGDRRRLIRCCLVSGWLGPLGSADEEVEGEGALGAAPLPRAPRPTIRSSISLAPPSAGVARTASLEPPLELSIVTVACCRQDRALVASAAVVEASTPLGLLLATGSGCSAAATRCLAPSGRGANAVPPPRFTPLLGGIPCSW